MNILKRNPLILIFTLIIAVILIGTATFGGTYSWFMKTMEEKTEQENGQHSDSQSRMADSLRSVNPAIGGVMGTVDIYFDEQTKTIENNSTIPIILRVRVILEWVSDTESTGLPPTDEIVFYGAGDWLAEQDGDGGIFLVYTGNEKLESTEYGILEPGSGSIDITYSCPETSISGWTPKVTLIAEALQATQKAYDAAGWQLQ